MSAHPDPTPEAILASARRTLQTEAQAIADLAARLDDSFVQVVGMLLACRGRVVVSGIGKTGHIARKLAATLASTGTPAFFVHAAEAIHGDLGMVTRDDVLIAISYSGTGQELLTILPVVRRMGAGLIAITGNAESELARLADVHLDASVSPGGLPRSIWRPPPAPRRRWPWATPWRSPAWRRAASAARISRVPTPAAPWAAACSPTCAT
ncbi:NDP-sugar epimerase [Bordetella pertussis]|nr:NDP-sugar epimerase [Bordetella pertussis]